MRTRNFSVWCLLAPFMLCYCAGAHEGRVKPNATTPPTFISLLAANEASDGIINLADSNSSAAMFALEATNFELAEYSGFLANESSPVCDASQTYAATQIPAINQLTSEGAFLICVKLTNQAGNTVYGKSQAVARDISGPSVNVGPDLPSKVAININATVTDAVSFAWSKISGPGDITFSSPSSEDTTVNASADGTYVLRLTATDNAGNTAFDELTLTWGNVPLAVNVGADESREELFTKTAVVTGATKYTWSVTSGKSSEIIFGTPDAVSTTILSMNAGIYTIRLTVSNQDNETASDEFILIWGKKNHLLFISSATIAGSNASNGNAFCQSLATAAKIPGNYIALLSTELIDANTLVAINGYVRNMAGDVLAKDSSDMWDGEINHLIGYDEKGISSTSNYWTGSHNNGTRCPGFTCNNWSMASSDGYLGDGDSRPYWLNSAYTSCSANYRLLCLSSEEAYPFTQIEGTSALGSGNISLTYRLPAQVANIDRLEMRRAAGFVPPANCSSGTLAFTWNSGITANGILTYTDNTGVDASAFSYRICIYNNASALIASYPSRESFYSGSAKVHTLFVSSASYNGNLGGLSGADSICQSLASAASRAGTYKAILSSSTISAASRITISGNVRMVNGILLAGNSADFWDGTLLSEPNLTEQNQVKYTGVFTNTTSSGQRNSTTDSCTDWTSTTGSGASGSTYESNSRWINGNGSNYCTTTLSIYCISQ